MHVTPADDGRGSFSPEEVLRQATTSLQRTKSVLPRRSPIVYQPPAAPALHFFFATVRSPLSLGPASSSFTPEQNVPLRPCVLALRDRRHTGGNWTGSKQKAARKSGTLLILNWLRGQDLNLRPLGYEPNELPDCSTPRQWFPDVAAGSAATRGAIIVARFATVKDPAELQHGSDYFARRGGAGGPAFSSSGRR